MTKIRYTRIQRFCLHDGPGIRTTVFLFGCNLRCPWCCNPENLVESEAFPVLEAEPDELARELIRDKAFFGAEGGVTLSGGEPLLQAGALVPLLVALKAEGVHVAVETALLVDEETPARVKSYIDLFIVDFKPAVVFAGSDVPTSTGEAYAGFRDRLAKLEKPYWLRTVYVDRVTTDGFLDLLGEIASLLPPRNIEVLPCHELGSSKLPTARRLEQSAIVYSFDIFDTIVTRCVKQPQGIFECVAHAARVDGIACPDSFPVDRIAAEAAARRGCVSEEVDLEEIYAHFGGDYSACMLNALRSMEERAEIDLCIPIEQSVARVNELCDTGKRIVLVSDMYLSRDVIEEMLRRCGLHGYERLYLSSEIGFRKSTGRLFEYVIQDLNIEPDQLLHVGDDDQNDMRVPRSLGIRVDGEFRSKLKRRNIVHRVGDRVNRRRSAEVNYDAMAGQASEDLAYRTGYSVLGPLLYAFSNWLNAEAEKDGVEELFFVSRDGFIIKRAYDVLFPDGSTHYLYGSRRAMTVPRLRDAASVADAIRVVGIDRREITVGSFVVALGLSADDVAEAIEASGLRATDRVLTESIVGDARFASLYEAIKPAVLTNSTEEDRAFSQYMRQTFTDGGRVGFVDIGWSGSTQRAMSAKCSELGIDLDIVGYYTGLRAAPGKPVDRASRMKGFLFDFDSETSVLDRQGVYNALYETFFGAQHGSVARFAIEGGDAVPVFSEYEHEGNAFAGTIRKVQEGAIAFVLDAQEHKMNCFVDLSPAKLLASFERLGLCPTLEEADLFGSAPFLDYGISCLADPPQLLEALRNPREIVNGLIGSCWKPAYLRKLFKLPAPYGKAIAAVKGRL